MPRVLAVAPDGIINGSPSAKNQAIDCAQSRPAFRTAEIRILDLAGMLDRTILRSTKRIDDLIRQLVSWMFRSLE
jgi:hypothetical protein